MQGEPKDRWLEFYEGVIRWAGLAAGAFFALAYAALATISMWAPGLALF